MKKIFPLLVFTLLIGYSSIGYCWSFNGHVVIAQVAYDSLTPEAKSKADELANGLFTQLTASEQTKLIKQYPTASTFARIATLPDIWRKWHLGTIFRTFNAPIPLDLISYANQSTQPLHFINLPYPATTTCQTIKPFNVVWAISHLENDFKTATNQNTKAVLMLLLEHYVGDSHQPLHVITNVSNGCAGDEGGNNFCIKTNASGKCTKNLHTLWDNAWT